MYLRRLAMLLATGSLVAAITVGIGTAGASPGRMHGSGRGLPSLTFVITSYAPSSLDPVKYDDYPEDTIIPNMCDSLLRQVPGMRTVPNLARSWSWTSPTTLHVSLQHGVRFWDGTPMTSADVVYSLERNMDPKDQSIYAFYFRDVRSITASGPYGVTVRFSHPDYLFVDDLAQLDGAVVEKSYTEKEGAKLGTPAGGIMCTGPYELKSWNGTTDLVMVRNAHYWDKALEPKVKTVTFVWPSSTGQVASGFEAGTFSAAAFLNTDDIPLLRHSSVGKLFIGPESQAMQVFALIVVGTKGAIANPLVREALYLSINRAGIIKTTQDGAGWPAYSDAAPGYDTYASAAYAAAYAKLTRAGKGASLAKKLVREAGKAATEPIVLATSPSSQSLEAASAIIQASADAAGLHVELKNVPLDQYGELFSDPSSRKGIDALITENYDQDPDPMAIYDDIALPNAISNFNSYDNPSVTKLLNEATATQDLSVRARLIIEAQSRIMKDLPWIPLFYVPFTSFVRKGVCGVPRDFSIMTSPWAASVHAC